MPSPWVWTPKARRYRNTKTGRWIGTAQMTVLRDQYLGYQRDRMQALADRVGRDAMTRREMVLQAREIIKSVTLDTYALAKGGRGHMTPSDYGKIGAMCKAQYQYLQQLEQRLKDGKLSAAQLAYQLKAYVNTARAAYAEGQRGTARALGEDEERRVLHPAEHCPDCVAAANRGWQPIGTLPKIGESECRHNCKCTFEFRKRPAVTFAA